ncbi:uncharacterized protein B0I36DRAFT_344186 [Microdochium trichocladiopsis]|uniref:Uncharacterized protein n=1 Tax=Microdochium trichocladiopsis TaxID=1682393 RepID=A0A9P9BZT1_9PEZI|nr:uncharacterized protein B0I36DRAFT_344186 [Microdochium trichocladiopsis]KAH7040439.1 hypothetical protein B0I36DRAFT_344186 [Microdochium trichocladiopsis]
MAGEGKDKTPTSGGASLSQRDLAVVAAAWHSLQEDPKLDYEKFKVLAGYGSTESARVSWRLIKKKLLAAGPDPAMPSAAGARAAGVSSTTPKSTAGAKKQRGAGASAVAVKKMDLSPAKAEGDDEDDELLAAAAAAADAQETPTKSVTKKKRGRPAAASVGAAAAPASGDAASHHETPARKKGRVTTIQKHMADHYQEGDAVKRESSDAADEDDEPVKKFFKMEEYTGNDDEA